MSVIPTQDNLQMDGAGLIGKSGSGVGLSGRMDAAAVRSLIGSLTQPQIETLIAGSIAALVDSSPGTLDTLNELAAALGDDPNFAATTAAAIAAKYTRPGTGIPQSDLSSAVQALLTLAGTALQSLPTHGHAQSDITGLVSALAAKQNTLTAGRGINLTGDTISAPGFGSLPPAQISGVYRTGVTAALSQQLALVANRLYKIPIVIGHTITVTSAILGVTALSAGSSIRIGIRRYNESTREFTTIPSGGDFGTVSSATTGNKILTGLSCTLTPGLYAIEMVSDGTPSVSGSGSYPTPWGAQWTSGFMMPVLMAFRAYTFGTLPIDETSQALTAVNSGAVPVVGLGV